jgi:uncharacterized protein YkwD
LEFTEELGMTFRVHLLAAATGVAAVALTVAGFGSLRGNQAYAAGDCTVADNTFDAQEKEFARLINEYRASKSLPALTVSVNLNREASWHAKDMADKNYFSHTDSLNRSPETRGRDCGTTTGIGENIAAGTVRDTAQEAFDAWKASDGHNKNMLNGSYKQIGIARYYGASSTYGWYWVTDFSLNSDGTNALSGGSSATSTPTKTATKTPTKAAATATPSSSSKTAAMVSPAPNTTLPGTSATFKWNAVSGASQYWLYVGTSPGASNIKNTNGITATSYSVTNLPRGSVKVYVRLWTQVSGTWRYVDYTYTSAP